MKRLLVIASMHLGLFSYAQPPGKLSHFGGGQDDLAYGVCRGNGTDYYTSGYFSGTMSMGSGITLVSSGSEDMYVAKHDSAGKVLWARKAGGTDSDMGFSVSYNNGFVYVSGVFSGTATFGTTTLNSSGLTDGFIAKYNSNGNLIWVKKVGGTTTYDRADEIVFEGDNIMYMCASIANGGTYDGVTLVNAGGVDAYILKMDTAGNLLKHTNMGGFSNDYTYDLKFNNGGLYIVGDFASGVIDFGPAIDRSNYGSYDGFVAKYDTALNAVWANTGGGVGLDDFEKVAVDSNGNCYVTGYFTDNAFFNDSSVTAIMSGGRDGVTLKYGPTGTIQWVRKAGIHDNGSGREIKFGTSQNEIVVYGHFGIQIENNGQIDTTNGMTDGFVLKYDANGNTTSLYTFGGPGAESVCEVAQVENKTWIVGGIKDSSSFNSVTVVSNGGNDIGIWEFVSPVVTPPVGILELIRTNGFGMYPNPAQNRFVLQSEYIISSVEIYNLIGEKIMSIEADTKDLSVEHNLNNGLYFVVINGNNSQKLLICQ